MKLSVNYYEINKIGSTVQRKAKELDRELSSLINLINSLSNYWEGPDCNIFITKSTTYLQSKKSEVDELFKIGSIICKSSNKYGNKDVEWGTNVRKEGLSDES